MEIEARVVQVDTDGTAWVKAIAGAESCHSCSGSSNGEEGGSCATGNIGRMFASRDQRYRVINTIGCRTGDHVILGITDGSVLRGSAAVYLLPLLLMFAGAIAASHLLAGVATDMAEVVGAAAGFSAASAWLWYFNRKIRLDTRFQPVILRQARQGIVMMKEIRS